MTEPLLISRQRGGLHGLYQLIEERAQAVPRIEQDFHLRNEAAEKEFQENCRKVIDRFESEKQASQGEFQGTQDRVGKRFGRERAAQDEELQQTSRRVTSQFEAESLTVRNEFQKARAVSIESLEANQHSAEAELEESRTRLNELIRRRKQLERDAVDLLLEWKQEHEHDALPPADRPDRKYKDAFRQLEETLATAQAKLNDLRALRLPRFFKGWRPGWLFLVLFLSVGGLASLWDQHHWYVGLAIGAAASLILGCGICLWLHSRARAQINTIYLPFLRTLVEADELAEKAFEQAREQYQRKLTSYKKLHDAEIRAASEKFEGKRAAMERRRDTQLREAKDKFEREKDDSIYRRDTELRQAHEKYQRIRTESLGRYENDSHQIHQIHYRLMTESKGQHQSEWTALAEKWQQGLAAFQNLAGELNRECGALFPDWNNSSWSGWQPAHSVPSVIRFGDYRVDLARLPQGLPKEERLPSPGPTQFTLPALLPFPSRSSLLVKTSAEARGEAVKVLQAVMLRYLTSLPPGKVRFTIIDPVGLGENFAAFMHLADYDEALVSNRIWTESGHIEQKLADLSTHMEDVIQKYLRNQYKSIEDYNAQAGEVAEPYRIPVIAHFPSNFTAEAARRLVSIVSSGARCGVYALITVDTTQDLPLGFQLADLEQHAVTLEWQDGRFVWQDRDFAAFPLQPDLPPSDEACTRILQQVGELAREANRVEVPFDFIAAPPEQWWKNDSRAGVLVALGRAGATKRQHLKLGEGTSQHVLIAGKTGSGKSSLLHALVTNAALLYSPEEIELYLIDFKKGVEFKTYAAHALPHARVVAIETDREFGLSVLQRLDAELKSRGERFRELGAQDLAAYRELDGQIRMPRILLIVDEFQEFFVEDDRVSQDASQLLDRLVRQGRAFGLHVLLGSQTLGGAYTLARSTIDQMAVRIALQCSETDAHLILSDGNSAARLLSRPGEAIYNDANGLVEGNNPFQVVWLPEDRREQFLQQIRELDRKKNPSVARPQIVFEGNAPAEIAKNHLFQGAISAPTWPKSSGAYRAWLGEAMAIKDPTSAVFRRQSGSNLIMVGQYDEAALGILASALVGLAVQHAPACDTGGGCNAARFYILDGTPADAPHAGYLAHLAGFVPHRLQAGGWRELPALIADLAGEVSRRQQSELTDDPEIYLLLYGLHRFRDLRKEEDDFGYSQTAETASPAKHFASILREGSGLGVHVLLWCDTLTNASRCLDRHAMREFSMRVLFQMSPNDSSTLIDSPLAGKLGLHRAYFHNEEEGRLEKFRPYGLPAEDWLAWYKAQLQGKQGAALGSRR
jgi:DNA segregation ATPase FtsK/SpoIIIE, S-DNA-T family